MEVQERACEACLELFGLYSEQLKKIIKDHETRERVPFNGKIDYSYDFFYLAQVPVETAAGIANHGVYNHYKCLQPKELVVQCLIPDNPSCWELLLTYYYLKYGISKKELCDQILTHVSKTVSSGVKLQDLSQDTIERGIAINILDDGNYFAIRQSHKKFAELYFNQFVDFNDRFVDSFRGHIPDEKKREEFENTINSLKLKNLKAIKKLIKEVRNGMP